MVQVQGRLLEMPLGLQDIAQLNHLSKTQVIIVMLIWVTKWGVFYHYLNVPALYFN
jgi:hypothetical protein